MAIGHHLVFRTPVPVQTVASIPLIVFGVLLFSGHDAHSIRGSTGILLALASNGILTARNIALKKLHDPGTQTGKAFTLRSTGHVIVTLVSGFVALNLMYSLVELGSITSKTWGLVALAMASGLFHVAYSYISTNVVLKVMNVVSHSIANIFKRIMVVLLLYAFGHRHASGVNFLGLAVAVAGVFIYIRGKTRADNPTNAVSEERGHTFEQSRRNTLIALCVLAATSVAAVATSSTTVHYYDMSHLELQTRTNGEVTIPPYQIPWLRLSIQNLSNQPRPDMKEFMTWSLVDHPEDTDFRAKTLTDTKDVVEEAQRILVNLLQDLLGPARHVMLMEIATYENKGDPAIAMGEVMLLRKMNISIVYYCSTATCRQEETLRRALEISKNYSTDELVILMQGGGNLVGYSTVDKIREQIMNTFPDRRLIMFSQSIWLNANNSLHLKECQELYSNRSNLVMFIRDRQSLAIAKTYFEGTKLILAPDLAFAIGVTPRQMPPFYDIVWLRRSDSESSRYDLPTFPTNISVHVSDWWAWKSNNGDTDMETAFLIASAGLQFLQRGRVVVTDRLHGHILSTLMDIPHVLIDNPPYLKLSSFDISWTANLSNTVIVNNSTEALNAAMILLQRYHQSLPLVGPIDMNVGMNVNALSASLGDREIPSTAAVLLLTILSLLPDTCLNL